LIYFICEIVFQFYDDEYYIIKSEKELTMKMKNGHL